MGNIVTPVSHVSPLDHAAIHLSAALRAGGVEVLNSICDPMIGPHVDIDFAASAPEGLKQLFSILVSADCTLRWTWILVPCRAETHGNKPVLRLSPKSIGHLWNDMEIGWFNEDAERLAILLQ